MTVKQIAEEVEDENMEVAGPAEVPGTPLPPNAYGHKGTSGSSGNGRWPAGQTRGSPRQGPG